MSSHGPLGHEHHIGLLELSPRGTLAPAGGNTLTGIALRSDFKEVAWDDDEAALEHGRRLVACWNACHGISTENLEDNGPMKELAARYNASLARVAELEAKVRDITGSAGRAHLEAFKGNIDAINKLDIDPMGCQSILSAVQNGDISTGRARELLRCWVLGTFTHDMLPPHEHGELLSACIQEDKSAAEAFHDLLAELGKVMDYARRLERIHVSDAEINYNHITAMRAAVIEEVCGQGSESAMKWIRNTLAGPGFMPKLAEVLELDGPASNESAQKLFDREMAAERQRRADLPDPLPIAEPNAHTIQKSVMALVGAARDVGYEVCVYQVANKPLAQGNHSTWVSVYRNTAGRKADEAAKAAQEAAKP